MTAHARSRSLVARIPWWEIVFTLLLAGGGTALWWYWDALKDSQQFAACVALGLAGVLLLRRFWRAFFGPILFYDLVRSGRRGSAVAIRILYLGLLFVVLFFLYWEVMWSQQTGNPLDVLFKSTMHKNEAPKFAQAFFSVFMAVQFLMVFLLTPVYTAGAIAEEKDRKTLEFLLATDLGNGEVVLGKLLSRLGSLFLVILTGLPILSLLQFLGGVDPNLIIAGFLLTLVSVLSLACLGTVNSVLVSKPRTAILLTYMQAAFFLIVTGLIELGFPSDGTSFLYDLIAGGNIVVAVYRWYQETQTNSIPWAAGTGPTSTWSVELITAGYACIHLLVAVVSLLLAVLILRRVAEYQTNARGRRSFVLASRQRRLPRVWNQCLLWKELFAEPMFRFNRLGMVLTATFITCCMIFGFFILVLSATAGYTLGQLDEYMNSCVRYLGTFVVCFLLLGVAIRAAGSIGSERDKQTLESLLTAPVESGDIVWAKWMGSILSGRKLWWYVGMIWLAGLLTGGLNVLAFPLLLAACSAYAIFLSGLGMFFSLISKTTTRAYIWTLTTVAVLCCSHWLVSMCLGPLVFFFVDPKGDVWGWVYTWRAAMVPPYTLASLGISNAEFHEWLTGGHSSRWDMYYGYNSYYRNEPYAWEHLSASLFGLVLYTVVGMVLYGITSRLFNRVAGRLALEQPKTLPARKPAPRKPVPLPAEGRA